MPTTLKDFESVFPKLVEELKSHANAYNFPQQGLQWYEKVLPPLRFVCVGTNCMSSHYGTTQSVANAIEGSPSPIPFLSSRVPPRPA